MRALPLNREPNGSTHPNWPDIHRTFSSLMLHFFQPPSKNAPARSHSRRFAGDAVPLPDAREYVLKVVNLVKLILENCGIL